MGETLYLTGMSIADGSGIKHDVLVPLTRVQGASTIVLPNAEYTLVLSDVGLWRKCTNDDETVQITIPANADTPFPLNATIIFSQHGDGLVTLIAGDGVTLLSFNNKITTAGQYAVMQIVQTALDEWTVFGNLGDLPA